MVAMPCTTEENTMPMGQLGFRLAAELGVISYFVAFNEKENTSLISFLRPVSFELVCLCTAMQNFSRLL